MDSDLQPAKDTGSGHVGPDKRLSTSLQGIANKARREPKHRFRDLYRLLDEDFLRECWRGVRKSAACGVDQVSAADYERDLDVNIRNLVERLKQKRYRAKLVRRQWIPKGSGKLRPLGIPVVEDKLLQVAVARILSAIYEPDFLRCSYGYRPGVGAHDAVDKLTVKLQFGKYNHIVEVDLENYFGTIDHKWLHRMLAERIDDGPFLRLIGKWLKAGVLETDGQVVHPAMGTPQGGVVSPVLANVYLHYVLDLWFHRRVARRCRGEACLIRYADDFVCAFERADEADRFMVDLETRLEKFGLRLSRTKTRKLEFPRTGDGRASLRRFTDWCRNNRHRRLGDLFRDLNRKLTGYYRYFGIYGNGRSLSQFHSAVVRIMYKWLNRRSQLRSYNWAGFRAVLEHFAISQPRIWRTATKAAR